MPSANSSAARLAARGFTARGDSLECDQGFASSQSDHLNAEAALGEPPSGWHLRNNLFKYHAACYLTHAPIECAKEIRLKSNFPPERVRKITLRIDSGADKVCNIPNPTTGLEAKFSLRQTVAMALTGVTDAGGRVAHGAGLSHNGGMNDRSQGLTAASRKALAERLAARQRELRAEIAAQMRTQDDPRLVGLRNRMEETDDWARGKTAALARLSDELDDVRVMRWGGAVHDVPLQWPALVAGLVRAAVDGVQTARS